MSEVPSAGGSGAPELPAAEHGDAVALYLPRRVDPPSALPVVTLVFFFCTQFLVSEPFFFSFQVPEGPSAF